MNLSRILPSTSDQPSREEVETQLSRLLASDSFRGARRSQDFLRLIVREALAGHQDGLGGYRIGLEVFGRSEDFDPQTDPIVRVEAGRMRQRLERYYLAESTGDEVLFEVPKGAYVPRFSKREADTPSEDSDGGFTAERHVAPRPWGDRVVVAALSLALLLALALGLWWFARPGPAQDPNEAGAPTAGPVTAVVLPFDYATDGTPHPFIADGLVEELIDSLAALPEVEVVALGSARRVAAEEMTPPEIARALEVDYLIRGEVRQQRTRLRITVSVVEASSALVLHSKPYDATLEKVLDLQAEIARDVARSLVTMVTPEFERRLQATGSHDAEVLALYHQATGLRDPPSDPVRSRLAEDAYRRVIELDPAFAGGHAGLAYVLAFRSWWGLSEQPEADARAGLEAARRAVELDRHYGWAQMSLSIALNVAGDHEGSLAAARRASQLSPSDPYVLAFAGIFQAFAGEVEAGIPLTRSAIRLDPLSVRAPYRNVAGVVLFHAGRFEEALGVLHENIRLGGPDGPHMAYYRAAALARLGQAEEAREELEGALAFPYEFDIREFLVAFSDPREARELLDSLEAIGFDLVSVRESDG